MLETGVSVIAGPDTSGFDVGVKTITSLVGARVSVKDMSDTIGVSVIVGENVGSGKGVSVVL